MYTLSCAQIEELRQAVQRAGAIPGLSDRVQKLYEEVQQQVHFKSPRCDRSGRCCRFETYGHRLFITTLELAAFFHRMTEGSVPMPGVISEGCPYQIDRLCSVHPYRPFGCRMFFCDPAVTEWQQEQYEHFHLQLRQMHTDLSIPYWYVEWRQALRALVSR